MEKAFQSIGEIFRDRRNERNLSLKEIETATSIRINYLQAIEEGKLHKMLSPIYSEGFIKQYAQYLGLDGARLLKEQLKNRSIPSKKHDFAYGLGTLEVRPTPGGNLKWLPNALWVGVTVIILIAAYGFAKYVGAL